MGLIVLWASRCHKEKTPALCPSLYPNHSEATGSTGRVKSVGFPRAMIGFMPVGSGFSTASTRVWRAKVWGRPSTLDPELLSRMAKFTWAPLLNLGEVALPARPLPPIFHTPCPPSRLLQTFLLTWSGKWGWGWERGVSQICAADFPQPLMNGPGYIVVFYCVHYLFVITFHFFSSCLCPQNVSKDRKHGLSRK